MLTDYNKIRAEIKDLDEEYTKIIKIQNSINEKRSGLIKKKCNLEKKIIKDLLGKRILTTVSDRKTAIHIKELDEYYSYFKGTCIQWKEDGTPILKMEFPAEATGILLRGFKEISEEEWKNYLQECFETEEFKNL